MATQLFINDVLVDLIESVDIPLNKQIADIATPENRSTSFTKTVKIPGTKANNKLFGFIFDVNCSIQNTSSTVNFFPDFNPNLKASCSIYVDSILQMKGYIHLIQVNVLGVNNIEYEVAIYGELGDLFGAIGTSKLIDLDLSQYNHTWNATNITNSWDTSIMDTAGVSGVTSFAYGTGYVYPFIDYGITDNPKVMLSEYFFPAIYVKTIVDKIFSSAGYGYSAGSFFNTAFFKRLIIPFTGSGFTLSLADVGLRTFEVSTATSVNTVIGNPIIFDTKAADTYSQYDTGTGLFTFNKAGTYSFNISLVCLNVDVPFVGSEDLQITILIKINGALSNTLVLANSDVLPYVNNLNSGNIPLNYGDIVKFELASVFSDGTDYTSTYSINTTGTILVEATSVNGIGSSVDMNNVLPPTILQRDFLTSLTKMFNLYWDNTSNQNEMVVNPRQTYLTNNVLDWTSKIDISKPVNIIPMGALDANPYVFTYKEDSDFYNDSYFKEFGRSYGDLKYYINNDFVKDEKKIDLIFSPTVMANEPAWSTNMVLPSIKTYDSSGVRQAKAANIRILYYGGFKASNGFSLDGNPLNYFVYPFAGHMDDPYNLTVDLSFDVPQKLYYGSVGGTVMNYPSNINLFDDYYKVFIDDITNKDSKIVRAYFNLNAQDINQIDFSYLYFFMGQYFRLNKVIDHIIGGKNVTQCEFIKAPLSETGDVAIGIGVMAIGTTFIIG